MLQFDIYVKRESMNGERNHNTHNTTLYEEDIIVICAPLCNRVVRFCAGSTTFYD